MHVMCMDIPCFVHDLNLHFSQVTGIEPLAFLCLIRSRLSLNFASQLLQLNLLFILLLEILGAVGTFAILLEELVADMIFFKVIGITTGVIGLAGKLFEILETLVILLEEFVIDGIFFGVIGITTEVVGVTGELSELS